MAVEDLSRFKSYKTPVFIEETYEIEMPPSKSNYSANDFLFDNYNSID